MKIMSGSSPSEDLKPEFTGWAGDNPYFLVINTFDKEIETKHVIDLDEPAWMSEKPELMRCEAEWILVEKNVPPRPVLGLYVMDGEQPYYAKRHIGVVYGSAGEIIVHGIGKKDREGHVNRLWIMPNGIIMTADDCNIIGSKMLENMSM